MLQLSDALLLGGVGILLLQSDLRDQVAMLMLQFWDQANQFLADNPLLPPAPTIEAFLVALGSVTFIMIKTRKVRQNGLNASDNRVFFATVLIGLGLGLFTPDG